MTRCKNSRRTNYYMRIIRWYGELTKRGIVLSHILEILEYINSWLTAKSAFLFGEVCQALDSYCIPRPM